VISGEFLGWCDMSVGFRAAYNRTRDQKLGVSARQLAGGGLPVDGKCYKDLSFFPLHLHILILYRAKPKRVCMGVCSTSSLLQARRSPRQTRRPWVRTCYAVGKDRSPGPNLPTTYGSAGQ
jgi:hypothetical protein